MITTLKLMNFRGIKEGELELAPLTILLGGNNSAKSTILEALFLAPNPFRRVPYVVEGHSSAAEVIHSLHETLNSKGYAFLLNNYTVDRADIECEVEGKIYLLLFNKSGLDINVSTNRRDTGAIFTVTRGGVELKTHSIGHLVMSVSRITPEISDPFIDNTLLISSRLIKPGYEHLKMNWASIINLGVCKSVAENVSKLVYDKYKDITIEPFLGGELAIYGFLDDGRRIRLGDLGEGVQNYVVAQILYELEHPKVLLWDDIEAHLNPRMLLSIAEWFFDILEKGDQVIVTTHSLEAARTIAGVNEEKTAIYLTALEKGTLKTRQFTLQEIEEYLEAGIDARAAEPILL